MGRPQPRHPCQIVWLEHARNGKLTLKLVKRVSVSVAEIRAAMKMFVRLLMLVTLMGTAQADILRDLFDPPGHYKGTVGYVEANHFVLVSPNAEFLRVFVKPGEFMPASISPGMIIECSARPDQNNFLRLETIDGVQTPDGQMVPLPVSTQPSAAH